MKIYKTKKGSFYSECYKMSLFLITIEKLAFNKMMYLHKNPCFNNSYYYVTRLLTVFFCIRTTIGSNMV